MRRICALLLLTAAPACGQNATSNPFPSPIRVDVPIVVGVADFAQVPDAGNEASRMMTMVEGTGMERFFVSGMRGRVFTVSSDGSSVTLYMDVDDTAWGIRVNSSGRERGVQSFTLHPDFSRAGAAGFGKIYVWTDTDDTAPEPDFRPREGNDSHDTVLLEFTASDPSSGTYDGGPPREVLRIQQPFGNHNGGQIAFDPTVGPGDPGYGMLYVGVADGGSGGDPQNLSQDMGSLFGKIIRIDPLGPGDGAGGANGEYGIPSDNPFVGQAGALGEIYVLGVRNPQRFGWDSETGMLYVADIGQNAIEELSPAPRGANLGWNVWEGSYRFVSRSGVSLAGHRSDPAMTYPVAEYAHDDPIIGSRAASTGVVVYREGPLDELRDLIVFGDFPSGEILAVDADNPPEGGNAGIRRVLLRPEGGEPTTLLALMQARNRGLGKDVPGRTDLRFATAEDGRVFLTNKHDGMIRVLVP